ncbi:MAG TPA: sirohydrochlorin cobaltochelatase [Methanothrix sp.]|jgi:sirohydrochlorin cobaltochelatase|nr:MAG: sirohydrochlorin cobaltochelatase [Methanosaeta sp. PtaU1.Bin055]HNR58771.1 sirohydrochlorin cobaltochelatase [Methanothrix sp.]HNT72769.1 sirohydrochlorin cobaltochelatase [Methanothrix sp.]HPY73377.1 sirohydrochlorin cobaltochelatase [Methanothrix sp.]HQA62927.1 sirohydrochlorin cobaltochelatase [Methanothrix sp.]
MKTLKIAAGIAAFALLAVAGPTSAQMSGPIKENPAILLVVFGTSYPEAQAAFVNVQEMYEEEFPDAEVRIAFTSDFIRNKIKETDGVEIDSPLTALAKLNDEGYQDVAVQSLHVISGEEFHDTANVVGCLSGLGDTYAFRNLGLGMPLLNSIDDYEATSQALEAQFDGVTEGLNRTAMESPRDPSETAVVLMGHGTHHPANSAYSQMAGFLEKDYENVFLGTVEGYPAFEDVLAKVKASGVSKVRLMPFMIVAGDHAVNDMAGDEAESWKKIFEAEGFETEVYLKGMGENDEIAKIFVEHTREVLDVFVE